MSMISPNWPMVACLLLASGGSEASEKVLVSFDRTPLIEVVRQLSESLKRNYIVPDELRSRPITIVSAVPVSPEEAHQAFQAALKAEGLRLAATGSFYTIERGGGARKPPRESCLKLEGIEAVDDHTWRLPRERLKDWLGRPSCLARLLRVVPHYTQGKMQGFKLFGVRRRSLFERLGFKNGDVIGTINGQVIDSPARAMATYEALKQAKKLQVELRRRGAVRTHTYLLE